ncbi:conserved hypothetical protein [Ricinus communis]|uniref:Uncharacterized protein n=1 Tax=Ricinus communis TaxID=3988 RepID=B9RMN9_RICCO|nr:conserved hypothetical protein [Ricinus communis]
MKHTMGAVWKVGSRMKVRAATPYSRGMVSSRHGIDKERRKWHDESLRASVGKRSPEHSTRLPFLAAIGSVFSA